MNGPPSAVLSTRITELLRGRRVLALVFTTFELDLGFFELQVLPVFFDGILSTSDALRRRQLEGALREVRDGIAVYYDRHGLDPSGGPARLDVRRIPIAHPTGTFHPKNLFALVEEAAPDKNGDRAKALLVGCTSANLTQSGWWTNVEAAHVVEIGEGEHTSLRDPLRSYLQRLVRASGEERSDSALARRHAPVQAIREFLRKTTQRAHLTVDGFMLPQFHGKGPLPEFLDACAGPSLRGLCLEVISPYFDDGPHAKPLLALLERFEPAEVRVHLPRNHRNEASCSEAAYRAITKLSSPKGPRVSWGRMPARRESASRSRFVHAKVYRFFEPKRRGREFLYVGSSNLTTPGFLQAGAGGNFESGFFVEVEATRPDWWLVLERERPARFLGTDEEGDTAMSGGSLLQLHYDWTRRTAETFWGGTSPSPHLTLLHGGVPVLELGPLAPRCWAQLAPELAQPLQQVLVSSSLLEVQGEASERTYLLVQEEGLEARPTTDRPLSASDILLSWTLRTPAERATFHERRVRDETAAEDPLARVSARLVQEESLFDRFAGHFHAFQCLERQLREAIESGQTRVADHRLFGEGLDSLGALLDRLAEPASEDSKAVQLHVLALSALQLVDEVRRSFPDYWRAHAEAAQRLDAKLKHAQRHRATLTERDPSLGPFLDWLEPRFLRRARPRLAEGTP